MTLKGFAFPDKFTVKFCIVFVKTLPPGFPYTVNLVISIVKESTLTTCESETSHSSGGNISGYACLAMGVKVGKIN